MVIRVYYTQFTQTFSEAAYHRYVRSVTFDPRFRPDRYRRWQDAQAHLIGRLLLIEAVATGGADRPRLPALEYSEYQRPYFVGGPCFSIAHSGAYVLCAVSGQSLVGVDVERIRSIELASLQPSFSELEWRTITAAPHPERQLFDHWVRKEAVTKADGRGVPVADRVRLYDQGADLDGTAWHLQKLPTDTDYCAYLASSEVPDEVKMIRVDYQDQGS